MSAIVRKVVKVDNHPNPEKPHLGVFTLSNGSVCIGVNNDNGSRRFNVDDLVVHIDPGSVIPQWLIGDGFQNLLKTKGKVKAEKFSGVISEGIMLNIDYDWEQFPEPEMIYRLRTPDNNNTPVDLNEDVTEFLGVR